MDKKPDKYDEAATLIPLINTAKWDDPYLGPGIREREIKEWRELIARKLRSSFPSIEVSEDAGECADAIYGELTGEDEGMSNPRTRHDIAAMIEAYADKRNERLRTEIDAWGCTHDHPTLLGDIETAIESEERIREAKEGD